jgi:preprotein translocase subunit SecD
LWVSIAVAALLAGAATFGLVSGTYHPQLGLDLEGGVAAILSAPRGTPPDVMAQALENIRRRVDAFGVGEPDIFLSGTTIEVQIPGAARSTIEPRPADLSCLVADHATNYGCVDDAETATRALEALVVRPRPTQVCLLTKDDQELACYNSRLEAEAASAVFTVDPKVSDGASPTASPSEGPAPAASQYCITDAGQTELACYPTRQRAEDARDSLEPRVTEQEFCVVDGGGQGAGPTGPSPSPTVAPSAFADLRSANDDLPCAPSREEAEASLASIGVTDVTSRFCVISSAGRTLGCFLDRPRAEQLQRETGAQRLLEQIGKTARLEERPTLDIIGPVDPRYASTRVTCDTEEERASAECSAEALAREEVVYFQPDGDPQTADPKVVLGPLVISGADIKRADAVLQGGSQTQLVPEWSVQFDLTGSGADRFAEATTAALTQPPPRNQIAIVVDRQIISNPVVQSAITGGFGVITGSFTEQEAKELATQLNSGALPVELTRQSVRTVSPTLGSESLRQGVVAGIVGLALLFAYLLFYYRLLGVVAWFGMAIWAALALGLVSLAGDQVGYTLTLAGVAGLVISLGVTADSYIVFFERLKDEVRNGRSARTAAQPAFKRAFRTIIAADVVTGIAAIVLYVTAVSSVRGFALTLGVATLLDLFVVYFFKRPTVLLIARNPRLVNLRGFGLTSGLAGDRSPADGARTAVEGA